MSKDTYLSVISEFISKVQAIYRTGTATEHSYRAALETLFNSISKGITAINEPKRVACGAPDFIIRRGEIVVGHAEAKDLGVDLRAMSDANKKQHDRYRAALPNLIYTNCLDWDFYRDGKRIASVSIGDHLLGIQPRTDRYNELENLLHSFTSQRAQTISSPRVLAQIMAGKARLIKDVLFNALRADKDLETDLMVQYRAFQEHLIHDISFQDFADIYAETIAYGLFAARLHDVTLDSFSRQEALELLPKSNPFLRSLFAYVAGHELDDRVAWIIDELADVFQSADVAGLMRAFGKLTGKNDPFLHFYETFLAAYNPEKRKARGVWYTPEPIVNFIVRAVDDVLRNEFGLLDGLADTSKVTIDWDTGQANKKGRALSIKKEVHRVQILDPATGTGTFLAEVVKNISPKVKDVASGIWSQYVERDLIPRLHGFELLMASYAMCHMKLDMILNELGYRPSRSPPRLSVYLTNSLEEGDPANQTLPFAQWLSNEVKQANAIKRDMPIMCVIGNPPYAGESSNKGSWIMKLMDDYKKEPGGKEKLRERNPKWINDDYVKFIRMSEYLIEKNGEGVLGLITNHGYLDNPTFRGMRWHLLSTFDKIYVLDLHGNSKKKEVTPEGKPDKNVFDIQQGVAIIIAVKNKKTKGKNALAEISHADLWGDRLHKYEALWENRLSGPQWLKLDNRAPHYAFARRNYGLHSAYERGISLDQLMPVHGNGIVTKRDTLNIQDTEEGVRQVIHDFLNMPEAEVRTKYRLPADVRDWRYEWARRDIASNQNSAVIARINYRPFDEKWIYYSGNARGLVGWPVQQIMIHYLRGANIGLLAPKAIRDASFAHALVTNTITEAILLSGTTGSNAMNFPLYLYPDALDVDQSRRINFDFKIYAGLQEMAKDAEHGIPDEVQIFDYIYGVLNCPMYRERYSEFLKQGFPRIPWPDSPRDFWDVSTKGAQLRRLHLLETAAIGLAPYPFVGEGTNLVASPRFHDGKVWINATQYFANAPEVSWKYFIGGYQPAQKWLKDRKGTELSFDDIKHYQSVLKALHESDRIARTITMVLNAA